MKELRQEIEAIQPLSRCKTSTVDWDSGQADVLNLLLDIVLLINQDAAIGLGGELFAANLPLPY